MLALVLRGEARKVQAKRVQAAGQRALEPVETIETEEWGRVVPRGEEAASQTGAACRVNGTPQARAEIEGKHHLTVRLVEGV